MNLTTLMNFEKTNRAKCPPAGDFLYAALAVGQLLKSQSSAIFWRLASGEYLNSLYESYEKVIPFGVA